MYAQYEPETDSVLLWAFTDKTEELLIHTTETGDDGP